jgi:hypothetical protein
MNKKSLWLRLCHYHFDHLVPPGLWLKVASRFGGVHASTKAFAHKLAQKQGWPEAFALKAVGEYKKFVYLGIVSEFVVTPPAVIDQVWHQHILFSKAYRDFCRDVICYEFDHHPELISLEDQTNTFSAQYLDTLALYRKEFGTEPPADIWGQPKFAAEQTTALHRSRKKEALSSLSSDSTPLYQSFDLAGGDSLQFDGFDDGEFGGAGAGGDWGGSDGSDTGGDGGDGGSGCSSCSSGCGGGD